MTPQSPLLSYPDAAQYLVLSLRHFRRLYIDSGLLAVIRVSPRRPRVRQSDLEKILRTQTVTLSEPRSV